MRITFALLAVAAGCAAPSSNYDTLVGELRRDDRVAADAHRTLAALTGAPALDRTALVESVLAANREITAMREAWRAAVDEVPAAGALDDPMLSYEIAPASIVSSAAPFGQRAQVRQKLPYPGKRGAARDAAVADAEAMHGDYQATRLAIAEMASQLFDEAFLNARAFEINDRHRELVTQMQKAAQLPRGLGARQRAGRAAGGGGARPPRARPRDARERTHRDHRAAQRPPASSLHPLLRPRPAQLAVPADPVDVATLELDALASRPQKAAAEARVRAGEANVTAADRAFYPDLEVMASYDSMWDMPEHRWMVGVSIEVPLQRAKRAAEGNAARDRVAQARAVVDQQVDAIRVEVARAHQELVESIHAARLYDERLLPAVRAQLDAALAGFTTGANDFPAVIQAERELREIQLAALRARADASRRQAALDRIVGKLPGGAS